MNYAMLCAVCMPQFAPDALAEFQALRLAHDPGEAARIGPHVTLVFPTNRIEETAFIAHVGSVAAYTAPAMLRFRSVMPWIEPGTGLTFLFLVPDEGSDWLKQLHMRLYSGVLAPSLEPACPYIPHLTLGRFADLATASAVADEVNARLGCQSGLVSSLEMVRVEAASVRPIASAPLQTQMQR